MAYLMVFPRTGAVRVFTRYNLIGQWYCHNAKPVMDPKELSQYVEDKAPLPVSTLYARIRYRYGHKDLTQFPLDTNDRDTVMELARSVAEVVDRPPKQPWVADTPQKVLKKGFRINLAKAAAFATTNLPKQAKVLAAAFAERGYDFYTEEEMRSLVIELVAERRLKTKQSEWRIFRYYRPMLIQNGVIDENI